MGLVFNDTSTMLGLCQETDSICGTTTASYPVAAKTRRANMALSDFVGIALASDNRWQFDDTNYTDLPIGVTDLLTSQGDYSFGTDMLKVTKVEMKDSAGNWTELIPLDRNDINLPTSELFSTAATPMYYDKFASSIIVYPTPNYTSAGGLKVMFQRDGSYFTAADTTKQPGIPSIFHKYIALKMSESYLRDKGMPSYVAVRNEIQDYEINKIPEYYSKRDKDERPRMVARVNNAQ